MHPAKKSNCLREHRKSVISSRWLYEKICLWLSQYNFRYMKIGIIIIRALIISDCICHSHSAISRRLTKENSSQNSVYRMQLEIAGLRHEK